jgi:hypothetical protein
MHFPLKWLLLGWPLLLCLQFTSSAVAAEPAAEEPGEHARASEEEDAEKDAGQQPDSTVLDRQKRFIDTQVLHASQWIDGFFADSNYEVEDVNSQVRIRPEYYYQDQQGGKVKMKVQAKIRLPNLGRRVSFVAGTDEDEDQRGEFTDDRNQNTIAGLQFFLSDSDKWNTSIVAGAKFNEFAFFLGPRVRYQKPLNDRTLVRLTEFVRWQTNNYWDLGSRADLYYVLNPRLYFRQTLFARWRGEHEDQEGLRTQVSSALSQRLSSSAGLQYNFTTMLHTEPDTHVDKYVLSLRFRKRAYQDWLYYEIAPQVAFEDEFDFRTNPGIRLRLEFFYGGYRSDSSWKGESEEGEEFRW